MKKGDLEFPMFLFGTLSIIFISCTVAHFAGSELGWLTFLTIFVTIFICIVVKYIKLERGN